MKLEAFKRVLSIDCNDFVQLDNWCLSETSLLIPRNIHLYSFNNLENFELEVCKCSKIDMWYKQY